MKTLATLIAFIAFAVPAFAQEDTNGTGLISVQSKGNDVRAVLHDMFTQAKRNYVLDSSIKFELFLTLDEVSFLEALGIVCRNAKLRYEVREGIYYITKIAQPKPAIVTPEKPKGTLPTTVLQKRVTTKLTKTPIRVVYANIAKQTGVTIEVDKSVPNYMLDAFLVNTSLKFALDKINEGAGLAYQLTKNRSILIYVPKRGDATD